MNRTAQRVLIIEDNRNLAIGLSNNLEVEGYSATIANDGAAGLECVRNWLPDLVILDLMLPDCDGVAVLAELRRIGNQVPVLILSARGEEADKVSGFRTGADDYVTKPFGLLELLGRIKALLRRSAYKRSEAALPDVVRFGDIEVAVKRHLVFKKSKEISLRPKEYDLLVAILRRRGDTVSKSELLREVWGYREEVMSRTVDTHVAELRRKLEDDPALPQQILTIRKAGYRLSGPFTDE